MNWESDRHSGLLSQGSGMMMLIRYHVAPGRTVDEIGNQEDLESIEI